MERYTCTFSIMHIACAREARSTVATNMTVFGVLCAACDYLGVRPHMPSRMPRRQLLGSPITRAMPEVPALHKDRSAWHRARARRWAEELLESRPEDEGVVFTDGSLQENGQAGHGVVVWDAQGRIIRTFACKLRNCRSSTQAELAAMDKAARMVAELNESRPGQRFCVVSDSQEAIRAALSPRPSTQTASEAFQAFQNAPEVSRLLWVPSHVGLLGNEQADELAAAAAAADAVDADDPDFGVDRLPDDALGHRAEIRRAAMRAWQQEWTHDRNNSDLRSHLPTAPRRAPSHVVGCIASVRQMARLRTGYCSTNVCLHRHGVREHPHCDRCAGVNQDPTAREVQTVEHLMLKCPALTSARSQLLCEVRQALHMDANRRVTIQDVLGMHHEEAALIRIGNAVRLFADAAFQGIM